MIVGSNGLGPSNKKYKMADERCSLTVGSISRLKTAADRRGAQNHFTVRVLDIYRYIIDSRFPSEANNQPDGDAFDVVITDGRLKAKCLLHPSFNTLVYSNTLHKDSVISISECWLCRCEGIMDAQAFVILRGLEVIGCTVDEGPSELEIEFCEDSTENEKDQVPLGSYRGYYLPLWNDQDPFGSIWNRNPDLQLKKRIDKIITIAELDMFWQTISRPYPVLVARVVAKSRLNHYGKSSDNKAKFPYQALLDIEDRTATASVCLWNSCCPLLYRSLHMGDVVIIANYGVSRKLSQRSKTVYGGSISTQIEVSINSSNPKGEVYKLECADISPLWEIPDVQYR